MGLGRILRKFLELWKRIGNVKPRRFVCDEYMKPGSDARIVIECAKGEGRNKMDRGQSG